MMQCNKTGLTITDWRTILDVLNVFDPNDIMHVYPEMGTPEFVQDVTKSFHKVRKHITRLNDQEGIQLEHTTSQVVLEAGPGAIL
tara:strand:+ start:717 stop:971 length:255 start_codon:yes stop_codon:yes gene_type:complete